jgi:hypothetical protein
VNKYGIEIVAYYYRNIDEGKNGHYKEYAYKQIPGPSDKS